MIREDWKMSLTAPVNVVKGQRQCWGVGGLLQSVSSSWDWTALGFLGCELWMVAPSQAVCTQARKTYILKQLSISAWRVIIWQSIKILIKSLYISTVTCTYPPNSDKITASLCTQANKHVSAPTHKCMHVNGFMQVLLFVYLHMQSNKNSARRQACTV